MAEFGAHLNQTASSDRPTIFEVIAQESMTSVLRPAISYALKVVASSYPDSLGWSWRYSDEIFALLDCTVQNVYLKKYGGSFSEHFYGLKRVPCVANNLWNSQPRAFEVLHGKPSLSKGQRYQSLLTLAIVPYIKQKLDQYFALLKEQGGNGSTSYTPSPRKLAFLCHVKKVFIAVYPFVHFIWESIFLCYQMSYMFSYTDCHSPLLHWIGMKLQRLSREDILEQSLQKEIFVAFTGKTLKEKVLSLLWTSSGVMMKLFTNGLPVVVFFLKFVEWWYSSDNSRTVAAVTQLPIPPPPPQPKPAEYGIKLPSHPAQCPLCIKIRTNPTVLSTSGYVFCYPCIYRYIVQHGCCPVTHLPSALQQLVRLYVNEDYI